jgi:hypothetical protein
MTRPNSEGVGDCSANPLKTLENQQRNSASDDKQGKAFASMHARAALCGCTLHELSDGYLVARWQYSKVAPCLRAVGDLLRQICGAR